MVNLLIYYYQTQEHIEELTGSVSAEKRGELWALPHKRFFFMTPQTFKNDLVKGQTPNSAATARRWCSAQSPLIITEVLLPAGICPADQIVCVVVDEAHRATGKYDIVTALNKVGPYT